MGEGVLEDVEMFEHVPYKWVLMMFYNRSDFGPNNMTNDP